MPNPIVPAPAWSDDIVVPDGDDFMSNAAEVVELMAQKLANREAYLKERIENDVILDNQDGTIAGKLTVNTSSDEIAPFNATRAPGQDNANPTNGWRPAFSAACDASGGRTITLWAGQNEDAGAFAVTVNAVWQPSPPRWKLQNSTKKAMALFMVPEDATSGFVLSMQDEGSSPWSSWPTSVPEAGTLRVGGGATVGDSLIVNKFVLALKSITSMENVIAGDGFNFNFNGDQTRARSIISTLGCVAGDYKPSSVGGVLSVDPGDPAHKPPTWTIRKPPGCSFGAVEIMHYKATTDETKFKLRVRSGAVWDPPTAPILPVTAEIEVTDSSAGSSVARLETSELDIDDDELAELQVIWIAPELGSSADQVYAISMVDWTESGPRNEVL